MKKFVAGLFGSSLAAVSASASPIGLVAMAGAPTPPIGPALFYDVLAAHPIWGFTIIAFGWGGGLLRNSCKRRAALRYA